jgi:hypothetical protein
MTARIRVLCRDRDGRLSVGADRLLAPDTPLLVGREGDVGVGVEPVDPKDSRRAAAVTRTGSGWRVSVTNRNGIIVHPWGQGAGMAEPDGTYGGARLAQRGIGPPEQQHWVLLEKPAHQPRRPEPVPGTSLTETADQPRPLTAPQEQAVRVLFGELLAWPPLVPATPRQIKQVASRLGVKPESIQRRLEEVRKKAVAHGFSRAGLLTDPVYLYVLVRAGYLAPAPDDLHPLLAD